MFLIVQMSVFSEAVKLHNAVDSYKLPFNELCSGISVSLLQQCTDLSNDMAIEVSLIEFHFVPIKIILWHCV